MQTRILPVLAGISALIFVADGLAHAGGDHHGQDNSQNSGNCQDSGGCQNATFSASGTVVDVPLDPDADSCTTASSGSTICTDSSGYANYAGTDSAFGDFTAQSAYDPVPGTGCIIAGQAQPIAGCKLSGGSEQGCQLQSVGGTGTTRYKSGDLPYGTVLSATVCIDLSSAPPFNFTGSSNVSITGGTGKFAGARGTSTSTVQGQELLVDPAGHGFSWFTGSGSTSITLAGSNH
jgi:hypothetical protein